MKEFGKPGRLRFVLFFYIEVDMAGNKVSGPYKDRQGERISRSISLYTVTRYASVRECVRDSVR